MKLSVLGVVVLLFAGCKQSQNSVADTRASQSAGFRKTTTNKVTVYHYTNNTHALQDSAGYVKAIMAGAQSTNKKLVGQPITAAGNVVGDGFYTAADPFSSSGYGRILLMVEVKPNVEIGYTDWDTATFGASPQNVKPCGPFAIAKDGLEDATLVVKSDVPAVLYCWLHSFSRFGKKALVVRDVFEKNGDHAVINLKSLKAVDLRYPGKRFSEMPPLTSSLQRLDVVAQYAGYQDFLKALSKDILVNKSLNDLGVITAVVSEIDVEAGQVRAAASRLSDAGRFAVCSQFQSSLKNGAAVSESCKAYLAQALFSLHSKSTPRGILFGEVEALLKLFGYLDPSINHTADDLIPKLVVRWKSDAKAVARATELALRLDDVQLAFTKESINEWTPAR